MTNRDNWTKEECRIRYVQGLRIGLRDLALDSGNSLSAVRRWCNDENWVNLRAAYQSNLSTAIEENTLAKLSERVSEDLVDLNRSHLESLARSRLMAIDFLEVLKKSVEEYPREIRWERVGNKDFSLAILRYCNVLNAAIEMERSALGMRHLDLDTAINEVTKAGYEVSEI